MGAINIIATILNMRAPWNDPDEDAFVRLDLVDHGILIDCGHAGFGGCGHHDVNGYPLSEHHSLMLPVAEILSCSSTCFGSLGIQKFTL